MLMITLITNVWPLGRTYYITPAGNYLALSSLNTHWARRIPIPEYATLLFKHQQPCPWLSHSAQRIWWSRGVRGYPRNDLLLLAQGTSTAEGQRGGDIGCYSTTLYVQWYCPILYFILLRELFSDITKQDYKYNVPIVYLSINLIKKLSSRYNSWHILNNDPLHALRECAYGVNG